MHSDFTQNFHICTSLWQRLILQPWPFDAIQTATKINFRTVSICPLHYITGLFSLKLLNYSLRNRFRKLQGKYCQIMSRNTDPKYTDILQDEHHYRQLQFQISLQ